MIVLLQVLFCYRHYRLNRTSCQFKNPVPSHSNSTRHIIRSGNISTGELRQRLNKMLPRRTSANVAAIKQQVSAVGQRMTNVVEL